MTRPRPGYSNLFAQVPTLLFNRLVDECDREQTSLARVMAAILQDRYKVEADKLPKPRRPGRRPKKKK